MGIETGTRVRINEQGRIVIPVEMRRELGLQPGDEVAIYVDEDRLIVETDASLLKKLRGLFAHIPKDRVLSEELIAERHAEAARELAQEDADKQIGRKRTRKGVA